MISEGLETIRIQGGPCDPGTGLFIRMKNPSARMSLDGRWPDLLFISMNDEGQALLPERVRPHNVPSDYEGPTRELVTHAYMRTENVADNGDILYAHDHTLLTTQEKIA